MHDFIKKLLITLTVYTVGLLDKLLNIKVYMLSVSRIGHLALNNDLFFRKLRAGTLQGDKFVLVAPGEKGMHLIANKTLYRVISNEAIKNTSIIFIGSLFVYKLLGISSGKLKKHDLDIHLSMNSNEIEFSTYDNVFYLGDNNKGWDKLNSIGIFRKKKIVCVFARDSAYLSSKDNHCDWSYHDYRNADIDTYIPAIKYLIGLGYFVIRVGSVALKQVNYSNKYFLDYPFSDLQSDFMDIFLINVSEFVIGTTSGITDVATVFGVPFLGVNYAPFTECPLGKRDMFIQKKLINKFDDVVEYKKIVNDDLSDVYRGDIFFQRTGLKYLDNTNKEILEATIEMQSMINGNKSDVDNDLINEYLLKYWSKNNKGNVKTPLCLFWLKKNKDLYI